MNPQSGKPMTSFLNLKPQKLGVIAMVFAGMMWGTSGTISRFLPSGMGPLSIVWTRMFIAGTLLSLYVMKHGSIFRVLKSKYAILTGICLATNQLGFFMSLGSLGVALSTMLVIGSSLIMEGLLDCFLGERPTRLWWCAAAFGVVGNCLLATGGSGSSFNIKGLAFGLLGGFAYSFVGVCLKHMRGQGFGGLESNAAAMLYAAVIVFTPAYKDLHLLIAPEAIVPALALGAVSMAIPYCLFTTALTCISVSQAYAIGLMEPFTAAVLGICLLGERIAFTAAIGMGLLVVCMGMSAVDSLRTSRS